MTFRETGNSAAVIGHGALKDLVGGSLRPEVLHSHDYEKIVVSKLWLAIPTKQRLTWGKTKDQKRS